MIGQYKKETTPIMIIAIDVYAETCEWCLHAKTSDFK